MLNSVKRPVATVCCAAVLLSACTAPVTQSVDQAYALNEARTTALKRAQADAANERADTAMAKVHSRWLGAKAVPLKNDLVLPEIFRIPKDFRFNYKMTISEAAERITALTGIPIRISQDVYASTSATGSAIPVPVPTQARTPLPTPRPLPTAATQAAASSGVPMVTMNATATPAGMLDNLCAMTGLHWEYRDGIVVVQRQVTRIFTVKAIPGTTTFNFSSGKSGSAQTNNTGGAGGSDITTGFTSQTSVSTNGAMAPLNSVLEAVKAVLSPTGKATASTATGTVTVVDTVDGIERAAKIIERENEILTRNATFKVEVLSFSSNSNEEAGVSWDIVFEKLGKFGAFASSPSSNVSQRSGGVGMTVLSNATGSLARYEGSSLLLNLLSELGRVNVLHSIDVATRNRNVTPVSIPTQTVYLAKTTPAPASTGGAAGGVPGLEPGKITTGFSMSLHPNILDSNQIALQFSVGLVELVSIKSLTSGTGINMQSIEAPQTSGFEFKQDVFLKPGETMILTGYERVSSRYDRNSLSRDLPVLAGGSFKGGERTEKVFIMITPTVVGNAN